MVLYGYLDWDGSYSGNNRSSKRCVAYNTSDQYNKVFSLFRAWSVKPDNRWVIIHAYGKHIIEDRKLTESQKINFINEAANNWKQFRDFVKEYQRANRSKTGTFKSEE